MSHHHPNNSAASLADLDAAEWLKAEFLLVTNPDGTLHRYAWIGETLIPLEPTSHPEYVAPADPLETAAADAAYLAQTVLEMWNPPERVMEQGEAPPTALDYIGHAQSKRTDEPDFDRDYARYIPSPAPPSPHFAKHYYSSRNYYGLQSLAIQTFALVSGVHGFDMAGKLLRHHLGMSGDPYKLPVDEMLADVPGFRQSVMDSVGFGLGGYFAPSDAESGHDEDIFLEQVGDHTVYAFPLEWREVGIGAEDDIFGFDGEIPLHGIVNLLFGQPIPDGATTEAYDWYLALGKFHYYPRVTVVVENKTGNAEVGIEIEVQDHYDWHADAGVLDSIMADLEEGGYGKNFQVFGRSSPIIGSFNLNDKTIRKEEEYYQLKIEGWEEDD